MSDTETGGTYGELPTARPVAFANWKPGDVIDGRMQVQELIGKGGMGVVWRVFHREWNRELAVKMPLPALVGSPTARDRFLREAETWIDLGVHPHIVQCLFVMDIAGLPSLFLDYLTGGSLKQWIDAGHVRPGQWEKVLDISIQIARGMAYAHSHGVIHRDIKPANLLVRGDERICITDFGIVKTATSVDEIVDPSTGQLPKSLSITSTGAFLGTPQYGAPEQWGSAEEVDVGADIYALGVTIYEMACGRRPFDSDQERISPEALIDRHLTSKAPDPRTFFPDIPGDLVQLLLLCLEKDPKRRPQSMERLQEALEGVYRRVVGHPYSGVSTDPTELRPDTLNNRAVSLYSLGKREEAREVWRKGLRIESGHPECLYNLTQMDKRAGRLDSEEALRRLRQARAGLPLALLCIEEGHPQEAAEVLRALSTDTVHAGPTQRALGDALMYSGQFYAAEKAYRSALTAMPADVGSQERKRLSTQGKRGLAGRFLFPTGCSAYHVVPSEGAVSAMVLPDSSGILGVNESACTIWDIDEECVNHRAVRAQGASRMTRGWCAGGLLVVEDATAFEMRRLPDLALLGRKEGRLLAVTRELHRLLVADRSGLFLFDVRESRLNKLDFGDKLAGQGRLLACFDQEGDHLCLLLPTGQVAQPDEEYRVNPEAWPSTVEDAGDATCLLLNRTGSTLYVGHASGRLQALNFETQEATFDLRLPYPVRSLALASQARSLVVRMDHGFVIVDRLGRLLLQGDGPAEVDWSSNRALVFHQGKLELFDLRPFRRLRTWSQEVPSPVSLTLARDGRRAVSVDGNGCVDVWEVDEDNRVYERSFLLSPGRSYSEIVSASQRFRDSLGQAEAALVREQIPAAYRHLNRARSVEGYAQSPDALDMNWRLLSILRRDRLEAVWERLNISSEDAESRTGPIALSADGRHLLVTFGSQFTLYFDTGIETKALWTGSATDDILAASVTTEQDCEAVLVIDRKGNGSIHRLKDGRRLRAISLERPSLRQVTLRGTLATYVCADGAIGVYDTGPGQHTVAEAPGLVPPFERVFPYHNDTVMVTCEDEFGTVSLGSKKAHMTPSHPKGLQTLSQLTYSHNDRHFPLLYLGFDDGSLALCDAGRNRVVFQLVQAASAGITAFELVPNLSVGVAATKNGQLLFFDLHTGALLEEFSAHRGRIRQLCISANGRYLATVASGGHVRLWETSWTACEDESEPPLEWLPTPTALSKLSHFLGLGGKGR